MRWGIFHPSTMSFCRQSLQKSSKNMATSICTDFYQKKTWGSIYLYTIVQIFHVNFWACLNGHLNILSYHFRAFSLDEIPARTKQGAAIIHMILNNLDKAVAQFPQELITYGGNGQVFSNWAQVSKLQIYHLSTWFQ